MLLFLPHECASYELTTHVGRDVSCAAEAGSSDMGVDSLTLSAVSPMLSDPDQCESTRSTFTSNTSPAASGSLLKTRAWSKPCQRDAVTQFPSCTFTFLPQHTLNRCVACSVKKSTKLVT